MASLNKVRLAGYLLAKPIIKEQAFYRTCTFTLRTMHRELDGYFGYNEDDEIDYRVYEDVRIMTQVEEQIKEFEKLEVGDVLTLKGVFNILVHDKKCTCPECGNENVKHFGTSTFIYPVWFKKINALKPVPIYDDEGNIIRREKAPLTKEEILAKHYAEVSNEILIIGTVMGKPEATGSSKHPCTRYQLRVDRSYYVPGQDDRNRDFPWVYSYGKVAISDYEHLHHGSLVCIDGFIRNRWTNNNPMYCESCHINYLYNDVATEFIPYNVEYLDFDHEGYHLKLKEEKTLAEQIIEMDE